MSGAQRASARVRTDSRTCGAQRDRAEGGTGRQAVRICDIDVRAWRIVTAAYVRADPGAQPCTRVYTAAPHASRAGGGPQQRQQRAWRRLCCGSQQLYRRLAAVAVGAAVVVPVRVL